jgi:hypothetical protein
MKLREYSEPLSFDTAFWMGGVHNPDYPLDQLGSLSLEVSEKLRGMAIIVLLTKGDSDTFYHNLMRSGIAREIYLRRCRDSGLLGDHHRASGRYEPFLDAVAAGDFALAGRIAALSPAEWMADHEYEDDYCYARSLFALIAVPTDVEALPDLTAKWEAFLDGEPSAKLAVVRALQQVNQREFNEGFSDLLRERKMQIAADIARGQFEKPTVIAQRQVFIEGLALLRLAGVRGLTSEAEYMYCPAIARRPMRKPFTGE